MKKVTSALALAALVGTPAAHAVNVEFGGDVDARYFNTQATDVNEGTEPRRSGFEQRIRLATTLETDGGVSLNARINLFNDRWSGDGSGVTTQDSTPFTAANRGHRNVELDYGYVSMPLFTGQLNVGRMISSWNNDFTAADDRRDQVSFVQPLGGGHTAILGYQLRRDGGATAPEASGSQYYGALLGPLADNVTYGVLAAHYDAAGSGANNPPEDLGYNIRGAQLLAPYIAGEAGDFNYMIGGHYFGGSRATDAVGPAAGGGAYQEDTFGVYAEAGFQLTPEFLLEGQVAHAADGTLIAGGYDSYSSLIHNSPDHNQSPTRIGDLNLGGAGTPGEDGDSSTLVAFRGTQSVMDWTFKAAVGFVNYERGDTDEDVIFGDLQAHYQLNPATTVYGTAGYADSEDYLGRDVFATSVNLNVQF